MIEIVKMTLAHVPEIARIERSCFSSPWSEASVASELENPLSLWLVAVESGKVAGYVGSQTVLGESDMMNLAVEETYRRQGVGRALVIALCETLKKSGASSLTLEVRSTNEPAKVLYESLGFQATGCRPNYYLRPKEDAIIYRKDLHS